MVFDGKGRRRNKMGCKGETGDGMGMNGIGRDGTGRDDRR